MLNQVINQGAQTNLVNLKIKSLHLKPYILGLELNEVQLTPKNELTKTLNQVLAKKISARLSLMGLIRGQIRLARVEIQEVKTQIFIDTQNQGKKEINIPLEQIFKAPIDFIEAKNITLLGKIKPQDTVFKLEHLHLKAENRFRSLWVEINAPSVLIKPSGPNPPIDFQLEARGLVETDQIRLTALKAKRDESFLISSGFFWGDIAKGKITSNEMATKIFLNLNSIKDWVAAFKPDMKFPKLNGAVKLITNSGFKNKNPFMNFEFEGTKLSFNQFNIGKADFIGTYTENQAKNVKGRIQNPSGKILIDDLDLSLRDNFAFEVKARPQVEIGRFLSQIGLKDIPVHLQMSGKTSCRGNIKDTFYAQCEDSEVNVKNLHVYNQESGSKKTIVKLKSGSAKGAYEINETEVKFAADLMVGENSKGSTKGSVDFKNGFVIFFQGDQFDFSDVENLANLKLEGSGSLEGETRGNSRTAKLSINAKMKDFSLDDYHLGQLTSAVKYEKGYLHFKDTSGLYGSTRYTGHLSLNLPDSQLYLYVKSPYLELPDIKSILRDRLPMNFPVSGTGNAEFKASGPIDITQLDYEVKASLFRGSVARETFDSVNASLRAQQGVLSIESMKLLKGPGEVNFSGTLRPEWHIDLTAVGERLRLEQSERIGELGLDIQGNYSLTTKVVGKINSPSIEISAQTSNMVTGNLPVEDSKVNLKIFETHIEGDAQLLGNKLTSQFNFPFSKTAPFSFKAKANELNVFSIFEAVSQARQTYNFETSLSMDVDLSSQSGGLWSSSGYISIDEFLIKRGSQSLSSDGKMNLIFNRGQFSSDNFSLTGENNYLKLDLKPSTKDSLNGRLNGKVDLNLIGPFLTFATEVRGLLSLNTSFKGSFENINVSGSAYLDKGYLKAKDFPHPFTDLRADMLFNQKTLIFNSIQGEVADGKISGDGKVRLENADSLVVQLAGSIKNTSVNFPEGYRTKGSMNYSLTGQRFPYRMKMDYQVDQATISTDFGGGDSQAEIKKSPYLPPSIAKTKEEPFYLDLSLQFNNPLLISNSMMNASINGNLNIQGTSERLIMKGSLTPIPGGTVFFRDVPFEISTGFIEYDSVVPENPKLYLAANARVEETVFDEYRRQTERQYDVNMLIQGRAQNPQVSLTSQPPLPQKDIVSLLALGMTPEALDDSKTTGAQVTSTSTTALGAALLQKPVGKRLKDNFGVDMKVTSSQNTADVASAARVTLSKQWTPKLSIAASGTLEANPQSSVRLEYQVNKGLSVIGSWEGREQNIQENQQKDVTNSVLGLDLEYRMQFK